METTIDKTEQVTRDDNHVYRVDGIIYPGATELLSAAGHLRGIEYVSEEALWNGKVVHEICRQMNNGNFDEAYWNEAPQMKPFGTGYQQFLSDTGFNPQMCELMLHHPLLKFCGQFDVIGLDRIGSEWWLIDYKSSLKCRSIGKWVGYQLALYHLLVLYYFPMMKRVRRFGLKLMGTGKYNLVPFADPDDYAVALSCIQDKNGKV